MTKFLVTGFLILCTLQMASAMKKRSDETKRLLKQAEQLQPTAMSNVANNARRPAGSSKSVRWSLPKKARPRSKKGAEAPRSRSKGAETRQSRPESVNAKPTKAKPKYISDKYRTPLPAEMTEEQVAG